jgi:hypothetical protein
MGACRQREETASCPSGSGLLLVGGRILWKGRRREMDDPVTEPAPHHVDVPQRWSEELGRLRHFRLYQQILKLKVLLLVGVDPASPSFDVQLPVVRRFAGQHMRHPVEEPVVLLIDWKPLLIMQSKPAN